MGYFFQIGIGSFIQWNMLLILNYIRRVSLTASFSNRKLPKQKLLYRQICG
jgi:hypothetical protein